MALFKTRSGKWRYEFEFNKERYTGSGYLTKAAARAAMEQERAKVKGERPGPKGSLLSDLIVDYLEANERRLAPKTWKYKRFVYQSFLFHASDLPIDQVVPLFVETYLRTQTLQLQCQLSPERPLGTLHLGPEARPHLQQPSPPGG